ncbi:hypothetical protein DEJ21_14120 [Curtobacterium sp. MCSS17_006]|uniref:hypothetical protein n=1 Tax=Curtobacterium sp. MCSS17_006 TaxID=2175642 RepID=UPI000DA7E553|nr:hypothetical protein [Curtobacterium sp. MCSS17_006]PZE33981.1 hypothetical protein DEJ21_14120 [Curtobacterium sp. MCSS17_006]
MSATRELELNDTIAAIIQQAGLSDSLADRISANLLPALVRYLAVAEDQRLAYDVESFAGLVSLSRTTVDEAAKRGDLVRRYPAKKKPLITREDALQWLRNLPTEPKA